MTVRCTIPANSKVNTGLAFIHSTNIIVRNITLADCGYSIFFSNQILSYFEELVGIRSFAVGISTYNMSFIAIEVDNLTLRFVSVQNSSGYGIVIINSYGVSISYSSFSNNTFVTPCALLVCRIYLFNPLTRREEDSQAHKPKNYKYIKKTCYNN